MYSLISNTDDYKLTKTMRVILSGLLESLLKVYHSKQKHWKGYKTNTSVELEKL